MDNKTNLKIKKYNMIMWSFLAKSALSQPIISIGHIILFAYSVNAPRSPRLILSVITKPRFYR